MVNLFEPFVLSLLKTIPRYASENPPQKPTPTQNLSSPLPIKIPNKPQNSHQVLAEPTLFHRPAKEFFFSEVKMERWMDVLKQNQSPTEELKPIWNFLFPEIPWSKDRFYWEDERERSKAYGTIFKDKNAFYLCVHFDSAKTGKISIYIEYQNGEKPTCTIIFRAVKEETAERIMLDSSQLKEELKFLGKIRLEVEADNDHIANKLSSQVGIQV